MIRYHMFFWSLLILLGITTAASAEVDRISGETTVLIPEGLFWDVISEVNEICIAPLNNITDAECTTEPRRDKFEVTFYQIGDLDYVHISYEMMFDSPSYPYRGRAHGMWFGEPARCSTTFLKTFAFSGSPLGGSTVHHVEDINALPHFQCLTLSSDD